jgi:SAM-dependent methyltransferase
MGTQKNNFGKQNEGFFSGKAQKRSSLINFQSLENDKKSTNKLTSDFAKFNSQNFSSHIFKMIPLFYEVQKATTKAIIKSGFVNSFLDLGCSEGGLLKTVSNNSEIKSLGIDANKNMIENFNQSAKVENVEIKEAAFIKGWDTVPTFETSKKFDIVSEFFLFQFMNNDRAQQIKEVKKLMTSGGVFICGEKFTNSNKVESAKFEAKKIGFQSQFFNAVELTEDKETIISGMDKDMTERETLKNELNSKFKYVFEFWQSGNFGGFIASDNKNNFEAFKNELGNFYF